jgi:hypothetical protein
MERPRSVTGGFTTRRGDDIGADRIAGNLVECLAGLQLSQGLSGSTVTNDRYVDRAAQDNAEKVAASA